MIFTDYLEEDIMPGILYIVATPIGNLKDISIRALEVIKSVDLVCAEDTRHASVLLNEYEIQTHLVSYHKFNENERTAEIINRLLDGYNVALISDAGTPTISDPGRILVKQAVNMGIAVTGIPGPSAIVTALSISGLCVEPFAFYGFLPRRSQEILSSLESFWISDILVGVFLESPLRIIRSMEIIRDTQYDIEICVCNDLTKKYEKIYYGTVEIVLSELLNNRFAEKGEYTIIIAKHKRSFVANRSKKDDETYTLEATLVEKMIKENITAKEAIANLANSKYKKNDLYKAFLNLKSKFVLN